MKKPSVTLTNILLGVIAAEVVVPTVQAFAERQASAAAGGGKSVGAAPQPHMAYFPLREALHQAVLFFRRLFGQGDDSLDPQQTAPPADRGSTQAFRAADQDDHEPQFKDTLTGIADKLKDPAWAGMLAANDGNIALTDAKRAVPMPNSSQYAGRPDKNPYVGKGMKDHGRNKF